MSKDGDEGVRSGLLAEGTEIATVCSEVRCERAKARTRKGRVMRSDVLNRI